MTLEINNGEYVEKMLCLVILANKYLYWPA